MKIVCLSDTHTLHDQIEVPDGDILIHAGDFCSHGNHSELIRFNKWLGTLPHRHKVVIAGNHDWPLERDPSSKFLFTHATYLQDNEVTLDGIRIYGSPWQPEFFNWAFNLKRGVEIRSKWNQIPTGIDILVTHGPPHGTADLLESGQNVGCEELFTAIHRIQPKFHICGHIHSSYGVHSMKDSATQVINASTCDEDYRPVNPPIVFELG